MDHLCYLCLVIVMLLRLFIAAVWSPAGKQLISWLLSVMFNCVFVNFPCGILGQVWYLIVSIPDLCHLSYLDIIRCSEQKTKVLIRHNYFILLSLQKKQESFIIYLYYLRENNNIYANNYF